MRPGSYRVGLFVVGRPKPTGPALTTTRRGDILVIPSGVAHGFSQVKEPLVYSAIRIDPQHALQLK